jgi:hypothetical protein
MANKIITDIFLQDDCLYIDFDDLSGLKFEDAGQQCCEERYMDTDGDDLREYIGSQYIGYAVKDAPNISEDSRVIQEVQFLEILTTVGPITI